MRAEKRQSYTAACKREAVRLVPEQQDGVAAAARNVGRNVKRLRRWKRAVADSDKGAVPGQGRLSPAQEEWPRLRTDNTRLRLERAI